MKEPEAGVIRGTEKEYRRFADWKAGVRIPRPDRDAGRRAKARWDGLAKPLDGLGDFETVFVRMAEAAGTEEVPVRPRSVLVFCADNGIVAEGVSQSGQEVTAIVAETMGNGTSNVCRMAACAGAPVTVVNIGIAEKRALPGVLDRCVRRGTEDFLKEPAMTEEEAVRALETGRRLAEARAEAGDRLLALGEMGIGNTTTSAAVISALTGLSPEETAGRGAGLSDSGLLRKRAVIGEAMKRYGFLPDGTAAAADPERFSKACYEAVTPEEAFRVLRSVGGLDIAGICGAMIGAAEKRISVILDGVITAAAALLAERMFPGVRAFLIASHSGKEAGVLRVLRLLALPPLINGNMALGEGTGAVMLFPLLDMTAAVYDSSRTFGAIRMDAYQRFEKEDGADASGEKKE